MLIINRFDKSIKELVSLEFCNEPKDGNWGIDKPKEMSNDKFYNYYIWINNSFKISGTEKRCTDIFNGIADALKNKETCFDIIEEVDKDDL